MLNRVARYLASVAVFTIAFSNLGIAQQAVLPDVPEASASMAPGEVPDISENSAVQCKPAQTQQGGATDSANQQGRQTKRILGIVPNFRAVSANQVLPPQSPKEKFITASEDSFDYSAVLVPAVLAGYSMAVNETPEFHQGAAGYARYFWHSFADQTVENYAVEFIVPVVTREDTRYYTLGTGGFFKRTGYALSRAVVTRSDAGKETFNAGEVVGAGAAAGISNLYYPSRERTFSNTAQKWSLNVGIDAATFVFKEFWPDINHTLFHDRQ